MKDYLLVFNKIRDVMETYGIPGLYTSYSSTLHSITSASTPELQEALRDFKARIKEAHDSFAAVEWTIGQKEILKKLNADSLLGKAGYRVFKTALTEKGVNPEGAVAEIQSQAEPIKALYERVTTLSTNLKGLVSSESEKLPEGYMSLELVFADMANVDTVVSWRKQANAWYLIAHAAKLLDKKHPVDIGLPKMSKDSPLDATLCGPYLQIATVAWVFFSCLKLYEQVLKIVKQHVEIDKLGIQLASDKVDLEKKGIEKEKMKLEAQITQMEKEIKEVELSNIIDSTLEKYGHHLSQTDKNAARTAFEQAVPHMYEYAKDGGLLQFKEKVDDPQNEEMKKFEAPDIKGLLTEVGGLHEYMDELRKLEAKNKKEDEEETEEKPKTKGEEVMEKLVNKTKEPKK